MLLLNLSLWKEITFCIHCSPVAGLSGWIYIRFGISGSAFPATIHRLMSRDKPLRTHWSIFIIEPSTLVFTTYMHDVLLTFITYILTLPKTIKALLWWWNETFHKWLLSTKGLLSLHFTYLPTVIRFLEGHL